MTCYDSGVCGFFLFLAGDDNQSFSFRPDASCLSCSHGAFGMLAGSWKPVYFKIQKGTLAWLALA